MSVEQRLAKLERDNRRLRFGVGVTALLAVAMVLGGQVGRSWHDQKRQAALDAFEATPMPDFALLRHLSLVRDTIRRDLLRNENLLNNPNVDQFSRAAENTRIQQALAEVDRMLEAVRAGQNPSELAAVNQRLEQLDEQTRDNRAAAAMARLASRHALHYVNLVRADAATDADEQWCRDFLKAVDLLSLIRVQVPNDLLPQYDDLLFSLLEKEFGDSGTLMPVETFWDVVIAHTSEK